MKIRMLVGMAGNAFSLSPNEETDRFSDAEATRMIDAGYAVPVAEKKTERTTKQQAPETRG